MMSVCSQVTSALGYDQGKTVGCVNRGIMSLHELRLQP